MRVSTSASSSFRLPPSFRLRRGLRAGRHLVAVVAPEVLLGAAPYLRFDRPVERGLVEAVGRDLLQEQAIPAAGGQTLGECHDHGGAARLLRSEERRVGKECRFRWSPWHQKKNTTERGDD